MNSRTIKEPCNKSIKVDTSIPYKVDDILKLGLSLWKKTINEHFKDIELNFQLAHWNENIISEFKLKKNKPDDKDESCCIWKYFKSHGYSTSRINLYIFSTPVDKIDNDGLEAEEEVDNNSEIDTTLSYTQQLIRNQLLDKEEAEKSQNSSVKNDVEILYLYQKESEYTGELSTTALNKDNLYHRLRSQHDLDVEISEFDPLDYGYGICSIIKNGKELLNVYLDENGKRVFEYPSSDPKIGEHKVIHDVNYMMGFCNDKFGLGCISRCQPSCRVVITYFKDGTLYRKGPELYWIDIEDQNNSKNNWKAVIECNSKFAVEPLKQRISDSVVNNQNIGGISEIPKSEIKFLKDVLGYGIQGKVYKAIVNGKFVAVKTLPLLNMKQKFFTRELEIHNIIDHPNIIKVLSYSYDSKKLYIVMELFEGKTLHEILHVDDEDDFLSLKNKYSIAIQLIKAIAHLHVRENPIIHRDIKPSNVIINSDFKVKLCDLGVSKFQKTTAALMTTVGAVSVKGLPNYASPEILLQESEATVRSDIWSLGCTLYELYAQKCIWTAFGEEIDIKKQLQKNLKPNLQLLPDNIRNMIELCLSYDSSLRPDISNLLFFFGSQKGR